MSKKPINAQQQCETDNHVPIDANNALKDIETIAKNSGASAADIKTLDHARDALTAKFATGNAPADEMRIYDALTKATSKGHDLSALQGLKNVIHQEIKNNQHDIDSAMHGCMGTQAEKGQSR